MSSSAYAEEDAAPISNISADSDLTKRNTIVIIRKRSEESASKGVELGSFVFSPSLSLTEFHDDNIYATDTNEQDDFVTVIAPAFNLKSKWNEHRLDFGAGLELARYKDFTDENTEDYWLDVSGRYDFSKKQNVFGGFNYSREHEARTSPDAESGDTPTEYYDTLANFGYAYNSGNHRTRLAYTVNQLDFKNVTTSTGVIDNSDRDRTEQAIGLRYLYKTTQASAIYIEGVADSRDYDHTPDSTGNYRDSDGYQYSLGGEFVGSTTLTKLFIGSLTRDYQSADFEDETEFDFGLYYSWKFAAASKMVVKSGRAIEETTFDNSPGYLMTDSSIRLLFGLGVGKLLTLGAIATTADYYGIDRKDDYYDYSIGYDQQIVDNLQFSIDLNHGERNSSVDSSDYKINQIFLRITGAL